MQILHLDSDPNATTALHDALAREDIPCSVHPVGSHDELVRALSTQRIDLLVVDYDAPVFGGLAVVKLVRSFRANVPIIFLSSVPGEEAAIDAIKAGASDYVLKTRISRLGFSVRRSIREALERVGTEQVAEMMRAGNVPYQRIVDTAREGIWVIDAAGLTIYANRRMAEMLGVAPGEMLGRSFFSFMDDEARALAAVHLEHRKQGVSEQHEFRFQTENGQTLWAIISTNALVDENGTFLGALGMVTDITDRRRVEDALRKSEAQLRSVFESAAIGICLVGMSGQILKVNGALLRMLGLTLDDVATRNVADLVPLEDIEADRDRFRDLINGRRDTFQVERRILCKGGRELQGNVSISLVRDDSGAPLFTIAMVEDVTLRKRLAEQLARSERRFRQLVEKGSDLTMLLDADGTIRYASPAATSITGFARQEIIGRPLLRFLPPGDAQSLLALNRLRGEMGIEGREELRLLQKDGSICVVEASATGLLDDADVGAVALNFRDITERRIAESLRLEKEEAERASRAKSEFLSRMSHELRTPLNAILGFAQVLQRSPDSTPKQVQRAEYIQTAGQHLLHLINEVLDIARIESGRLTISPEPVDVSTVIKEALDLIHPLAVKRSLTVTIDVSVTPDAYVVADRQQLKQVLLNLISNAVKYNREEGSVAVSCAEVVPGRLRIHVIDTGQGIAGEKMKQLFVPFERLGAEQSSVEGAGLGLALCKRQVELMGGAIGVESAEGKGSTFWIELSLCEGPVARARSAASSRSSRPPKRALGPPRAVLYIEDNLSNLRLVADIMERWPEMRLMSAMTGAQGIEQAREQALDLILLDMHLPDMSGGDVLRRLQEMRETRDVPVVIISADATKRQIEQQIAGGARAYLTKPLDIALLIKLIEELLAPRSLEP